MPKRLLPLAAMEKIMKTAGAKYGVERVADDAKEALKEVLEAIARDMAKSAWEFAEHAGRKTIKKNDIEIAYENYRRRHAQN